MGDMDNNQTVGLLIVRAWLHDETIVARVTYTPNVNTVPPVTIVVTTPHQIHREVMRWLHRLSINRSDDPESEDN
jgi:hypothetical protein